MNVRPQQLAEVLLGVGGIWFIASAIPSLALFASAAIDQPSSPDSGAPDASLLIGVAHVSLSLIVGLVLFFTRRAVASHLFSDQSGEVPTSGPLQAAAFAIVGALLFSEGAAALAEHLIMLGASSWSYSLPALIGAATKAAMGAFLFFGASAVAAYWHRARSESHKEGAV